MSDLFHDEVPDDFIAHTFAVMALAGQHTFQLLTKRHGRMRSLLNNVGFTANARSYAEAIDPGHEWQWPIPNVWLGVSVENQQWADIRVPALIHTPAAVRFLSCEPLLGPVTFRWAKWAPVINTHHLAGLTEIDWVIVGGESGPGSRPMDAEWARTLRNECNEARIAFHFKQWGSHDEHGVPMHKGKTGRLLDGRTWDEFPEAVA
jgi:protein gp37